ncbi:MAG: metallophosphoesterase [Planctomycetales bacterium]|nr:metallophosphoesterase [Planctomycetales bacterium]
MQRTTLKILSIVWVVGWFLSAPNTAQEALFDKDFPNLDSQATGSWWEPRPNPGRANARNGQILDFGVPRNEVVAFAIYTHESGKLKMSAQLFPLLPDEPRIARLELNQGGKWQEVAQAEVFYPGWDAHFRVEPWDNTRDVAYRVRHGQSSVFEGLIRHDPIEKDEIVVGLLSCNSSRTKGPREEILNNLKVQNPDLLFFAGDQTYHHTEHTSGWLEWGIQFREILRDRPVVTIPDDHDVGQGNIWGENGKKASTSAGPDGGYFYPPSYVNMVQRQQTSHLPDPFDPTPIERGISVYYTRLHVGGIDFAILEDRKFKSGPEGKIPPMGPRPDHINDPSYDRKSVDIPGLKLLGDRQLQFLKTWNEDWEGSVLKCALSQTAFCGAVHIHGNINNRLLADLDSNAWPQSGRNRALELLRQSHCTHLCGDQHLAVVVKHGIEQFGDGPFAFTGPAIINTIYGRWWHPADEKAGNNASADAKLPWTGEYFDGLGNRITMLAYANPEDIQNELKRSDGYGLARFHKTARTVTFECWPRFAKVSDGDSAQFPGWPITVNMDENDGRRPSGYLSKVSLEGCDNPVVQVSDETTSEVLYTIRPGNPSFSPPIFDATHTYTVRLGKDHPDQKVLTKLKAQ